MEKCCQNELALWIDVSELTLCNYRCKQKKNVVSRLTWCKVFSIQIQITNLYCFVLLVAFYVNIRLIHIVFFPYFCWNNCFNLGRRQGFIFIFL